MRSTPILAVRAPSSCGASVARCRRPLRLGAAALVAVALASGALGAQAGQRPPTPPPPPSAPPAHDSVRSPAAERQQAAPPATGIFLRYPARADTVFRFDPGADFSPFGRFTFAEALSTGGGVEGLAAARAARLQQLTQARVQALWGQTATATLSPGGAAPGDATFASRDVRDRQRGTQPSPSGAAPGAVPPIAIAPAPPNAAAAGRQPPAGALPDTGDMAIVRALQREVEDSIARASGAVPPSAAAAGAADSASRAGGLLNGPVDLFGDYADLNLELNSRLEMKLERSKNERCTSNLYYITGANCRGSFQPNFDFQFNVRTGGVVADRVHVNVDYDSQREFDASNNISVYYEGKTDELIQRLEVGNVSFVPPTSRFITAGIPSGNYGVQAIGQVGPMRFRTIVAQQKGNVVKDRVFTIGDRSLQNVTLDVEDYKIEARRFFFTVDPRRFGGYPSIDILNPQAMATAAAQLPDSARPTKVYLYRLRFGEQPVNPNGPQFIVRGSRNGQNRGPVYELLREGVDYYLDPSQLWFALVRPLSLNSERLVVAYNVSYAGGQRSVAGGTPDLQFTDAPQFANLIYDPLVVPGDTAFFQEIRSIYRFGGEDIQRGTVAVKVVTGSSGDQEKPVAGGFDTYLQMLQLSQANNSSTFDIDNRLWPRPSDPNYAQGGTGGKLIKDNFLVFPSLRPFATRDSGLVSPGNVANDTIYKTPSEDLFSQRHPQSVYHIRAKYEASGGGDAGSLALGSVQISRNSERLLIGGVPLKRDVDYQVDYELGRVTFLRPDTLFSSPRQVTVQYEENPLFAAAPTAIFGIASQFPLTNGSLNFTAISQSQKTTFNRPPLGFEPASSLVAGVSGNFTFDADALSRALQRLPFNASSAPSRVDVSGEFATSRPQPNAAGQAYVESFEGEGGTTVTLSDPAWYYASQPADGRLTSQIPGFVFDTAHAATMAWQNNGTYPDGSSALFTINQIDPLVNITGQGAQSFEQILWLTLYPLKIGGLRVPGSTPDKYEWQIPDAPTGRRWRSVRTSFGPTGTDLSRVEQLEFWSLVDTSAVERRKNPTVVMDFGDISENTLAFSPTKLCVGCALAQEKGVDSLFTGKQVAGLDTMNTERDPLSRGFNVGTDDNGLPGDRVPKLAIATGENFNADSVDFPTCKGGSFGPGQRLGDARANCTILNSRLDEEDLDLDGQLNLRQSQRNEENILRYVIDMSQDSTYNRKGNCIQNKPLCWVLFRVPFRVPTDSINNPTRRRMNALRITVVSGQGQEEDEFTQVPIVRLRLIGSPWLKRSEVAVQGIGGEAPGLGTSYVVAGVIGTQDSTATLVYDSPPGVTDAPDTKQTGLEATRVQINERSMRLTAGGLRKYDRAEAYYRFPEGQRNFMGYRTLRVWAKGRGNGWGQDGELNFFVKIGRDADNFYMYRTPVQEGRGKAAWTDVRVSFQKFFDLRAQLQNAFLQGGDRYGSCSAADRALIDRSVPAATTADTSRRYAACGDGYMVYTTDPNSTPPNLAAVQELATGMVRVDSAVGAKPILAATDSLELWVDDIRLTDVVDTPGYAGQFGVAVVAGDVMDLRASVTRKDPNFRQLAEQPSFVTDNGVDVSSAIHLERLLPQALGLALPFSVSHSSASSDPFFLSESDLRGGGIQGLRTPQRSATAYSLGVRRTTPLRNAWLGPVFNNLALNSSFATADSRSEFQTGKSNNFTLGLDYNLVAQSRARRLGLLDRAIMHLPGFLKDFEAVRSLRNTSLRWTPTQLRFTSNVARATDTRYSFTKPADSPTDTARAVRGLTNLWRNGSAVELRPFNAIALRWDIASLRDLRDYRDRLGDTATRTLDVAPVAQAERNRLLGMDVGLERERTMSTALNFVPVIASWIRPHVDIGTSYSMLRDPNTRTLLRANADSTGEYRLPRRLSNSQTFTAGAQVDLARGAGAYFKEKSPIGRLAGAVQPLDVTFNRSLLSAFDGVPFTPGLGYQFGLGSVSNFLSANGRPATSAGLSTQLAVNGALNLPLGASLQNRYQRTSTRNWARRFDNSQGVVDGDNVSFPNVSLRWNPPLGFLSRALTSFATNADYVQTKTSEFRPTNTATPAERSATRVRTYRLAPSAVWGLGISTAAGYALSLRDDQRPGSSNTGRTEDYNVDLGKAFAAPARFQLRTGSTIRTRLSYQASHTSTFVFSEGESSSSGASGTENRRVRLADNGRNALNFNGESDLADNVTGSLVFSRIITFDEQNNRRYSQTVFSAVLHLQFYSGEKR